MKMTRENTIGAVHWEGLQTAFDGERFLTIIPAYFQPQHVPYLESVIKSRLSEIDDSISVSLNPGRLTQTGNGSSYESGTIVLTDVTKPWPDAEVLRTGLEAAFVEAGEIELEQRAQARELERHLRSAPRPADT